MARKVFFSFHYENDINRAMIVRNSWVTQGVEKAGFIDKAEFEQVRRQGTKAIENWIDGQLVGTSVTVVLIGSETLERDFVQYEIRKSIEKGNAIIGVKINNIADMRTGLRSSLCNLHVLEFGLHQKPRYISMKLQMVFTTIHYRMDLTI